MTPKTKKMHYPWEMMEKIREARRNRLNDFTFVDHDGEQVEVHIEETDPNIISQFDWMS